MIAYSAGSRLGPYEIIALLGEGGMGQVYRAHDSRTGRDVALKVTAERFSDRFSREVHAVAALNHPHICQLYDVGPNYLVMELCEGETLAARLKRGKLPVAEAVRYGGEMADALAAAHEKGIVHRDLKPGNVMLTKAGVKVLDFGLAKMERRVGVEVETETETAAGTIMGTVAYMSPEQAQGKATDARSDIFSFGLVFYEMITGKRAFAGSNAVSTLAAILEREAPSLEPEGLNRVVRACLEKDPGERIQSAVDLKRAIGWSEVVAQPVEGAGRSRLAWGVAGALAAGLGVVGFLYWGGKAAETAGPLRFQISAPENARLDPLFSVSPNGRKLAFLSGGRLWVHSLESGESRDVAAADGTPFWSPDSRFIGFPHQGKLKKIESTGGPSQTVTDYGSLWGAAAWNRDDVIVFSEQRSGFFRVHASGGVPVPLTTVDSARQETVHWGPSFLPDGRHFLHTRWFRDQGKSAVYVGSVDAKPEQQSAKPLVNSMWHSAYAPSADAGGGYLLYMRENTLMAQSFDKERLELTGQAVPIAEEIRDGRSFSVSSNDVLVFHRSATSDRQLTWYDRDGKVEGTAGEPGDYEALALSPDGTRLAVAKSRGTMEPTSIWLLDLSRGGVSTRLMAGSARASNLVWSPDGSRIVFSSNRDGPFNLYEMPANGEREAELLLKSSMDATATSWSRDGRFLLYETVSYPKTRPDVWVLPFGTGKKPILFLGTEFSEGGARISPDGRWVAYVSDESGRTEVYVRSISLNAAGTAVEVGGKWPISNGYGADPRWRADGREIYYRSRDGRVQAVEIAANPEFRVGPSRPLGVLPALLWDSAADGKRFLSLASKGGSAPYTVVLNWQAGLKRP